MSGQGRPCDQTDEVLQAFYELCVNVGSSGHPVPSGLIGEAQRLAMIVKTEQHNRSGTPVSPIHQGWLDVVNEVRPAPPLPKVPVDAVSS